MTSTTSTKRFRNITAILLAASAIAACGGSGESSFSDVGGAAQTRSGDDETVDTATVDDIGDTGDTATVDDTGDTSPPETTEPAEEEADTTEVPGTTEAATANGESGIVFVDGPTRFFEIDWTVLDSERRPDGPEDEGEDVDPSEDFIYIDVDAELVTDAVSSYGIPFQWMTLVRPDGASFQPYWANERATGDRLRTRLDLQPNRLREFSLVFAIDARDDFTGGYLELDQPEFEPAATGGPNALDETQRIPISFDTSVYEGPLSRDLGRIEIEEAYWSRELGERDDGTLIDEPWLSGSRRPPTDSVFLIVRYSLTCIFDGVNTGGCNAGSGAVNVDGERTGGSNVTDLVGYDKTEEYWVAYPVPTEASSVVLEISDVTSFVATDLGPLTELATTD